MGVQVSKGFLVYAENTPTLNYVEQAYALALSIKISQLSVTNISIVTNDPIPDEYKSVFDKIIEIPWYESSADSAYKTEHRWKLYHITPYEETIVLDTDMLFLEDVTSWWNYCNNFDIRYCSRVKNYKDEIVIDNYYRKAFVANGLSNTYSALCYFKKCDKSLQFYTALEFIINNWQMCYSIFAEKEYQNWLSMDLAVAIAIELTGMWDEIIDASAPLEFVHMKPAIQNWPIVPESWQTAVPCAYNYNAELLVGNIKQEKLFHYVEKDFLKPSILQKLQDIVNGRN